MGVSNYRGNIDEFTQRLIKHKARELVGNAGFTWSDLEDLQQELMLDLLGRLRKYNPERAKRSMFIASVVNHKIAALLESRTAKARDPKRCKQSLNEMVEDEDGCLVQRAETVDLEDYLQRTGRLSRPLEQVRDLKIDLAEVAEFFPPELRSLLEQLKTYSVTDISRQTGVPRGTIYESVKILQGLLEKFRSFL